MITRLKTLVIGFIAMVMSTAAFAAPGSLGIAWDKPSNDEFVTLAGYRLYVGVSSKAYTTTIDLPVPTESVLVNGVETLKAALTEKVKDGTIPAGTLVYLALTAINNYDLESDYSNEISFRLPGKPSNVVSEKVK